MHCMAMTLELVLLGGITVQEREELVTSSQKEGQSIQEKRYFLLQKHWSVLMCDPLHIALL